MQSTPTVPTPLHAARKRELAVRACTDPRTIERAYLAAHGIGKRPRGMAGDRAHVVLVAEGLVPDPIAHRTAEAA